MAASMVLGLGFTYNYDLWRYGRRKR